MIYQDAIGPMPVSTNVADEIRSNMIRIAVQTYF